MKIKIFLGALILISIFCATSFAFAITDAEKQTLITQIQQRIADLTKQLQTLQAQQQNTQSWCYTFKNNLGFAQTGTNDIAQLHSALLRQGISYTPDDVNTYSDGTSEAIIQFQTKYGISPQSGFVGTKTRNQLNQLYGCSNTGPATNNSTALTIIITPATVNLTIGGPTRQLTSETLQNGKSIYAPISWTSSNPSVATVNSYGIVAPVNSGTTFITANSGTAASNLTIVTVSATAIATITNTNNCKATCVTQTDGIYAVDCAGNPTKCDQGDVCQNTYETNYTYDNGSIQTIKNLTGSECTTPNSSCTPNWKCTDWRDCLAGQQNRTCADLNNCNTTIDQPDLTQSCTVCRATCTYQNGLAYSVDCSGDATACGQGQYCQQTHSENSTYLNGIFYNISTLSGSECVTPCTPYWYCTGFGDCVDGIQTQTCTDQNSCGTTANEPATTQSCTP